MEIQPRHRLEHHVRYRVHRVLTGGGIHAADGGVLIGIAYARGLGVLSEAAAVEGVDLQEEAVHVLLRLIQGDASGLQVGFQVRPGVLVEAAQAGHAGVVLRLEEHVVHHGHLAGLPEGPRRFCGDMVQTLGTA